MLDVSREVIGVWRFYWVGILLGWRDMRGIDTPDAALSALRDPDCCQISGFEGEISAFLRTEDTDPHYEDGVQSILAFLRGLPLSNGENGNDTNLEAEGELRSSAAISAKHPFRTVLTF